MDLRVRPAFFAPPRKLKESSRPAGPNIFFFWPAWEPGSLHRAREPGIWHRARVAGDPAPGPAAGLDRQIISRMENQTYLVIHVFHALASYTIDLNYNFYITEVPGLGH